MQIDESKLPRYYTVGYLVSYALILGISLATFVLFAVSDAVIWPAPREAVFAGVSVSIAAIIGLATFALRGHVDPTGAIYGLPDGMTLAARRTTIRKYVLLFLFSAASLAWFLNLLLPRARSSIVASTFPTPCFSPYRAASFHSSSSSALAAASLTSPAMPSCIAGPRQGGHKSVLSMIHEDQAA
ncbi:MAG TPA: hypothetical protein VJ822_17905 [Dongiaceae bacterium]|nr:hypothetical protein [Dongiaceae bacterium]